MPIRLDEQLKQGDYRYASWKRNQKKSRWLMIGQLVGGAAAVVGGLALIALASWLVFPT